jgi:outer membrane lipoprotein carrier protein
MNPLFQLPTSSGRGASALRGLRAFALAAPLALSTQVAAQDTDASNEVEAVTSRVQAAYDGLRDFTASFSQTYTNQALDESTTSSGIVHFLRPGRMRWDYLEPTLRLFISDGEHLWIYEPEQAQYYTQSLSDSDLPTALRFMMGEGTLAEDFEISFDPRSTPEAPTLVLVPIRSEGQYTRLRIVVDPETWFVIETTIFDPAGNTNRLAFRDGRFNVGYEPGDFVFEPPDGAERVDTPAP